MNMSTPVAWGCAVAVLRSLHHLDMSSEAKDHKNKKKISVINRLTIRPTKWIVVEWSAIKNWF